MRPHRLSIDGPVVWKPRTTPTRDAILKAVGGEWISIQQVVQDTGCSAEYATAQLAIAHRAGRLQRMKQRLGNAQKCCLLYRRPLTHPSPTQRI